MDLVRQQIFSILALVIFLLKMLLKSASKSSFFFALASRSGFGATISDAVVRSLSKNPFKKCSKIVFFSLWRREPVLELQFPTPLCVVLLCFATQSLQIACLQFFSDFACLQTPKLGKCNFCVLASRSGV